ncbi:hypothetical protein CEXT_393931 [Caerostris extrusa]|uniref:Uncharacterized protein n=1 Tax=Caerostris extrusa TaxID=172846 RepID=A0AAV4RHT4_CAEEX|nr:hypothetical protein CEXT_393931 [Caerostris extrusa]
MECFILTSNHRFGRLTRIIYDAGPFKVSSGVVVFASNVRVRVPPGLKPSLIGQQIIFEADRVSMECVIHTSNDRFGMLARIIYDSDTFKVSSGVV